MTTRSPELVALVEAHPLRGSSADLLDDLALASSRYAFAAGLRDSDLWHVWLAIERERGRTQAESIDDLSSAAARRDLASWAFARGNDALGLAAYAAFLAYDAHLRKTDPTYAFAPETMPYLDALTRLGRLDEAARVLDEFAPNGLRETWVVVAAFLGAGRGAEAVDRMRALVRVYDDSSFAWAHLAIALGATGAAGETEHALRESCLHEPLEAELRARLTRATGTTEAQLVAWRGAEPPSRERAWDDWRAQPGERVVPGDEPSPHTFGGDALTLPDCRCGRRMRAAFVLDLREVASLRARLPRWEHVPLLTCTDCVEWMFRRDFLVERLTVRLLGVVGAFQPCRLRDPAERLSVRPVRLQAVRVTDEEELPDWEHTQVGGAPPWVQGPRRMRCRLCRDEMIFVAALASTKGFEPYVPINNESGFQYHFACNGCRTLSVVGQWT